MSLANGDAARRRPKSGRERFGPQGIAAMDSWFTTPTRRTAEATSVFAEVAHSLGYLEIADRVDRDVLSRQLDDLSRFRERDWTMSDLTAVLPPPSLIVNRSVFCFAPAGSADHWVFFGFDAWPAPASDPPLRDVRVPTAKAIDGLFLTPHGVAQAADRVVARTQ